MVPRRPFPAVFCCVCMLMCIIGRRTSLAKECTNIPTQYVSHTVRALLHEKEASASNISCSRIRTALASRIASRASLRKEMSPDTLHTLLKASAPTGKQLQTLKDWHPAEDADFSKVVQKLRHDNTVLRGEKPHQLRKSRSAELFHSFALRGKSLDLRNASTGEENCSNSTKVVSSAPFRSGSEFEQPPLLKEVTLHKVRLAVDSLHGIAQYTNLHYLLMLDVDSLVWSFRATSGLPTSGSPYGGWEHPSMELRGHFVGHYLSATALMWASTHNDALQEKMGTLVDALAECQDQIGTGYLSAFPSEFFDRFEEIKPVWAPYYTIHKIMAGLLDQYVLAGSEKSLGMLLWMVEYFLRRVETVIQKYTIERHWESLNEEVGGMNDILYRLFMLTRDPQHLKLAHLFDKPCFLGLLALQTDGLSGFHSNTHIPLVVGAQMRFEATGDELYADMSQYFLDIINTSHRYATGGTSVSEFWTYPNRNGDALNTETQETCTTYNMLKIARNMLRWTKDISYADYYERALVNGILGIQRGKEPGVTIYMLPQAPGSSKAISYHGWGTPYNSFWCCYGTGIESFSKLGDSIYFEDTSPVTLNVVQFVSSNLTWDAVGLLLSQKVLPLSSNDPYLHVTFDFYDLPQGPNGNEAELSLRIPTWAIGATSLMRLNGLSLGTPDPGSYFTISRAWKAGDILLVDLHVSLALEKVQDDRKHFSSLHAILFGPYLLAGMTDGEHDIGAVNTSLLSSWIVPVPVSYAAQLYTFSQNLSVLEDSETQELGDQVTVLSYGSSSAGMKSVPLEGTNEAAQCTFLLTSAVVGNSDISLPGSLVYVELYNQPGRLLAHNGVNRKIGLVDSEPREQSLKFKSSGFSNIRSSKMQQPLEAVNFDGGFKDGYEVFKALPALSGDENAISFEAATMQGCFVTSDMDGTIKLQCQSERKARDPNFNIKASFRVNKGLATYNPISFIAKGLTRQFLLFPIYAYLDERHWIWLAGRDRMGEGDLSPIVR